MLKAVASPYLVPFDGSFKLSKSPSEPPRNVPEKAELKSDLEESVKELAELQKMLYAHDRYSVLLVFQAMDAAGKDSTIRAVLSGVDPAGCEVYSFKRPSETDLDHDFLWRTALCLPQRGRIGVFNRSYYEEVLVVRVHPEYLDKQKLPDEVPLEKLWSQRFDSIRDHEKHLARNGTVIIKFWLNVSQDEQRDRLLARLDEPEKNWKFESGDLDERARWKDYMKAYEEMLNATSTAHAPWYAIPADSKSFMRAAVADIVVRTLKSMDIHWPVLDAAEKARFAEMRKRLAGKP
ncbi:PPK2 family polyphosphate:nucleotide phosphotransferase [Panacagrimonas perspica]|uniref:PPK2 family polyphosphate:nucleotide phosphotransferase n=1 Tax=Panacagrimonas perspica TaxID=381431 RepID=A0A4R7P0G4_9GAMM|nr:PPK2 family polyphosphate kinase [Panacagrimonas perspica]TDU26742.1 PPK2 family polyphosphate:nucleotide phosphotransferase [Panacagrimonas perspica]THD04079.1 phosphate--nucleotide phosphotransferase [Panacagrimonas perspica]